MKSNKVSGTPFWIWSNWQDNPQSIFEIANDREVKNKIYKRINFEHGEIHKDEFPKIEANLEYDRCIQDCPWPVMSMFMISDRVRVILDDIAPNNCQFFPVSLWRNGAKIDIVYWIMYVDSIDCVDPTRSEWMGDRINEPFIVEDRVPVDTHIFRAWYPEKSFSGMSIFVRDRVRRVLKREKVTGCFFYEPPTPGLGRAPRLG